MKNITGLPVLVIIVFSFLPAHFAYSQNYRLSIGHQFGFVHGRAYELVYPIDTKGEFLSKLTWEMKPVFYYGITIDFERADLMSAPGFFGSLNFRTGFPGDSGIHQNRDWRSTENANLTDFSTHTNKTREFYWLDLTLGASFPVRDWFYLKPFVNASWMRFAFSGRDGHGIYARVRRTCGGPFFLCSCTTFYPIDDDPRIFHFEGEVIRYEQNWLLIAAGFTIGRDFREQGIPLSFELSFQISPFTYCAARDDHLLRSITWLDFTAWGLFVEPALHVSFLLLPIELSLDFAYRHIGRTRGRVYERHGAGSFRRITGEAGAALSLIDLRLTARLNVF